MPDAGVWDSGRLAIETGGLLTCQRLLLDKTFHHLIKLHAELQAVQALNMQGRGWRGSRSPALADDHGVALVAAEAGRDVRRDVGVALLVPLRQAWAGKHARLQREHILRVGHK